MIQIKPTVQEVMQAVCPHCETLCKDGLVIWQGIHVCKGVLCHNCGTQFMEDLPVGHAIMAGFKVDLTHNANIQLYGETGYQPWFGNPLCWSTRNPARGEDIHIDREVIKIFDQVVILNCLDYLYGHSLLKLFNSEHYLRNLPQYGLIVIVPKAIKWMVPSGVAEIWSVNLPLTGFLNFYPSLHMSIQQLCERYSTVFLSKGYPHPKDFSISRYTGIAKHSFDCNDWRITFVWRNDRVWCKEESYTNRKTDSMAKQQLIQRQVDNICDFFDLLKCQFPSAKYTVAGLGSGGIFPGWIEDFRMESLAQNDEKRICQVYADSRLVIGVHGSNMILPSAHAGLTCDIIPKDRWGNLGQDIAYQEADLRMIVHRYVHVPIQLDVNDIAEIAISLIKNYSEHRNLLSCIP